MPSALGLSSALGATAPSALEAATKAPSELGALAGLLKDEKKKDFDFNGVYKSLDTANNKMKEAVKNA